MDTSEKFTNIDLVRPFLSCVMSRKKRIILSLMKCYPLRLNIISGIVSFMLISVSWDETGMKLTELWTAFEIAFCERKAVVFLKSFL